MHSFNSTFNILVRGVDDKEEGEFLVLMADNRVFQTSVELYHWEAKHVFDEEYEDGEIEDGDDDWPEFGTYTGLIVVSSSKDWDEAQRIADMRGWGEVVDGLLLHIQPGMVSEEDALNSMNLGDQIFSDN